MKINPLDKHLLNKAGPVKAVTKQNGADFKEVFERSSAGLPTESSSQTVKPLAPARPPSTIAIPFDNAAGSIAGLSKTLNHLERYSQQLSDGKMSLRSMEPVVRQLKSDADKLSAMVADGSLGNDVRAVANETLMLVIKEITWFEQGAYIDQ